MGGLSRGVILCLMGSGLWIAGIASAQAQICFEGVGIERCDRLARTIRDGHRSFRRMRERHERMEALNRKRIGRIREIERRHGPIYRNGERILRPE